MGSGTHSSKIDGFPGTHGTHANGATEYVDLKHAELLGFVQFQISKKTIATKLIHSIRWTMKKNKETMVSLL